MLSPHNDPQVEQWFRRLDAPLKRLPAAERVQIHQEVRQHLDALRAANEELGSSPEEAWEHALTQFGDPGKLGRQMQHEALTLPLDPNLWDKSPLIAASAYAFVQSAGSLMAATSVMLVVAGLSLLIAPGLPVGDAWNLGLHESYLSAIAVVPVWAGWKTGYTMKREGLPGTFYGLLGLAGPGAVISLCSHDLKFAGMLLGCLGTGCFSSWIASQFKSSVPLLNRRERSTRFPE